MTNKTIIVNGRLVKTNKAWIDYYDAIALAFDKEQIANVQHHCIPKGIFDYARILYRITNNSDKSYTLFVGDMIRLRDNIEINVTFSTPVY